MTLNVLLLDPDGLAGRTLERCLAHQGHSVTSRRDSSSALTALAHDEFDVAVLAGPIHVELLWNLRKQFPQMDVVVVTESPTLESAIAALRCGVYDYLTTSVANTEIEATLRRLASLRAGRDAGQLTVFDGQPQSDDSLPAHEPRLKVLFADDEPTVCEIMQLELSRKGHDVTVCRDGLAAIEQLSRHRYDCLIVDLDMPGRNGLQVIAFAKSQSPRTVAVILTGKSSLDTVIATLRLGVFDYLSKPCELSQIEVLLQRIARNFFAS